MSTTRPDIFGGTAFSGYTEVAGFTLISAIFLLVALSALGAYMVRFSSVEHISVAQDVMGVHAYQVARAGAEYGAYRATQDSACGNANLNFPGAMYSGLVVTLTCSEAGPYSESGNSVYIYTITAVACNRPSSGVCPGVPDGLSYVERRVAITLSDH